MPMEELLAMYGYGSASQQPLLSASDPAASNSANCSVGSSSSSSDGEDETAPATIIDEGGQRRKVASGLMGISGDTTLHTSRLLRCEQCISFVNKTGRRNS